MSRIFISYRRQDSEGYAGRLYDHLSKHFEVFMDVDNIRSGEDFVKKLEEALAACDVLIAVIGPTWLTITDESGRRRLHQEGDYVRLEIASTLRQSEKRVIPVLVGNARMPIATDLPDDLAALARRNAVEIRHNHFERDVQQLIDDIKETAPANRLLKQSFDSEAARQKAAALKALRDDLVNASTSPLYQVRVENRFFPVPGDGNPDARILFIGESPGKYEAQQGVPFCGPSGEVLEEMLRSINLRREDVYLTNLLLDSPGEKREPTPAEIAFYAPFVDRIIDIIRPAVIAPLGRFATQYLLKKLNLPEQRDKISQLHGKLIKAQMPYGEIHVVPLYHPAVVLYSASQKDTLRRDFQKLRLFT